jgi:hypothetical protein
LVATKKHLFSPQIEGKLHLPQKLGPSPTVTLLPPPSRLSAMASRTPMSALPLSFTHLSPPTSLLPFACALLASARRSHGYPRPGLRAPATWLSCRHERPRLTTASPSTPPGGSLMT